MQERIWGLKFEDILTQDDKVFRYTYIDNPFMEGGKYKIGLNEKFLKSALEKGIEKLIIKIGQKEIMMTPPSLKILKQKNKSKEFEDKPSMFQGSSPMRIYYFLIN